MRFTALAIRNLKEMIRDPLTMGLSVAMPAGLLLMLSILGKSIGDVSFLTPTMLAPGTAVLGFAI